MPSKFRVRSFFAPLVKKIANFFHKLGFKPNNITNMMVCTAFLGTSIFLLTNSSIIFAMLIFFTGILDGVDGALSRLSNTGSKYGGFLDSSYDRISEVIIYFGVFFGFYGQFSNLSEIYIIGWIVLWFLTSISSFMISYVRARVEVVFKSRDVRVDTNIGLLARSERLIYIILSLLFSLFVSSLVLIILFSVYFILIVLTMVFRIVIYRRSLEKLGTS